MTSVNDETSCDEPSPDAVGEAPSWGIKGWSVTSIVAVAAVVIGSICLGLEGGAGATDESIGWNDDGSVPQHFNDRALQSLGRRRLAIMQSRMKEVPTTSNGFDFKPDPTRKQEGFNYILSCWSKYDYDPIKPDAELLTSNESDIDAFLDLLDRWEVNSIVGTRKALAEHTVVCRFRLNTDYFFEYQRLHRLMAKKWEDESLRPVIDLELRKSVDDVGTYRFGVIGGVGQLADAEVLERLMSIISTTKDRDLREKIMDHMILRIHSNGPPRKDKKKGLFANVATMAANGVTYAQQMAHFLGDPTIGTYLMASNTAHSNYFPMQCNPLGPKNPFQGVKSYINVIFETVNLVKNGALRTDNTKVLVLGTHAAWEAKLYPNAFKAMSVPAMEVTAVQSAKIQDGINDIKHGKDLSEAAEKIMNQTSPSICGMIGDEAQGITHVVMGCSELSLAVTREAVKHCAGARAKDVVYVDTTQLMAHYIYSKLADEEMKMMRVSNDATFYLKMEEEA